MIRFTAAALAAAAAMVTVQPADAQTRLRFAHVYEVNEPYHTEAVWAAEEIAKRTNNRWRIEVFPASALGNEPAQVFGAPEHFGSISLDDERQSHRCADP